MSAEPLILQLIETCKEDKINVLAVAKINFCFIVSQLHIKKFYPLVELTVLNLTIQATKCKFAKLETEEF